MFRPIAILLLLIITDHAFVTADYCSISTCGKRIHTMCNFNDEISPNCKEVKEAGLTDDEKQRIVKYHNELRHKVANGEETRGYPGPQLAAKNMANLEWDDELAEIAQRWANQCTRGEDDCRDVERFEVGQNTAFRNTSGYIRTDVEDLIKGWYDEVRDLNRKYVLALPSIFSSRAVRIGHYTQIVWAKTTKVGCGAVKSKDGWFSIVYLVCNYGPAGNTLGEPIYQIKVRTLHRYLSGFFDNYEDFC